VPSYDQLASRPLVTEEASLGAMSSIRTSLIWSFPVAVNASLSEYDTLGCDVGHKIIVATSCKNIVLNRLTKASVAEKIEFPEALDALIDGEIDKLPAFHNESFATKV
jgi:hypothetical protein